MDETDIKIRVLERVRVASQSDPLPLVASEFSLIGTNIRADLALLSNDDFVGVEIKSVGDTLRRLPSQLGGYTRYFDYTILVAAERHLRAIDKLLLANTEVWSLAPGGDLGLHKKGRANDVKPSDLLGLLTQDERRRVLRKTATDRDPEFFGPQIIPADSARTAFADTFRRRYGQTSENFWASVADRPIERDDLNLLSRFHSEKLQWREAYEAQDARWAQWATLMSASAAAA